MDQGFVDLRLNSQEGQGNDSFWPSFTDIMTVIVMIFLIAMVVLLMRNVELVKQLRATMNAEEVATTLARETGIEKDKIYANLGTAEEKISMLQLQLMQQRENSLINQTKFTKQLKQNRILATENYALAQQITQADLTRQRLESDIETKKTTLRSSLEKNLTLEEELEQARSINAQTAQTIQQYQSTIADQTESLAKLRQNELLVENKFLVLVGEHDVLKGKYQKLIRPARSTKGRYLVEVRYSKVKGEPWVRWREGVTGDYFNVSRVELDASLTALKAQKPNGLYIKIIIPKNSDLSYSEAWKFTSQIHKGYDYYFAKDKK